MTVRIELTATKKSQGSSLRQKQKEATRRMIRRAAYDLFEEKGYEKMTMRELAARAGVGLGTIFKHFKDKPTLLVSVFEHDFHPLVEKVFASLPEKDLKAQLVYMVRHFYTYYARRPGISRILMKELYVDPNNSERINRSFQDDLEQVAALFEAAKQRGEIDPGAGIFEAVAIWWGCYSVVLLQALRLPHFDVDAQVAVFERLMEQHFKGIGLKD
jgi:AcrR family transcriptional regulator